MSQQQDISACVLGALEQYFRDLDGEKTLRNLRHGFEER